MWVFTVEHFSHLCKAFGGALWSLVHFTASAFTWWLPSNYLGPLKLIIIREYPIHFSSIHISLPLLPSYVRACCREITIKQEGNSILNIEPGVWRKGNFSFPLAKFPTWKLRSGQSTCSTWASSYIYTVEHCLCSFCTRKRGSYSILSSFGGLKWVRWAMHRFFLGVRRKLARPETGIQRWLSRFHL